MQDLKKQKGGRARNGSERRTGCARAHIHTHLAFGLYRRLTSLFVFIVYLSVYTRLSRPFFFSGPVRPSYDSLILTGRLQFLIAAARSRCVTGDDVGCSFDAFSWLAPGLPLSPRGNCIGLPHATQQPCGSFSSFFFLNVSAVRSHVATP